MKEIVFNEDKKIVKLLSKAKVNHLEIFSKMDFGSKKSKMTRLFELMRDNDFKSSDNLKTALYGKSVKSDGNFIKMYNKFQEKLYNTLFFIDTNSPMYIARAKAYFASARRMVLSRKLFDLGAKHLAIDFAEKSLPLCQKFEFTDLTIIISKFLMRQYGGTLLELKKYKKYKQVYITSMDLYIKESILEKYVNDLDFYENASKKKSIEVDSKTRREAYNYAIEYSENFPSIEILTSTARIIQYYFSRFKNPELYHLKSDILLKNLLQKKFESFGTLENIIILILKNAYLQRNYFLANEIYETYFSKFLDGGFNWYAAHYYFILTTFNSRQFQRGIELLELSITSEAFSRQPVVIKENFYVLQAYASFLIQIKKISFVSIVTIEFRINKFLNQVPGYSRDKQGINIPIILAQILFFLINKKYALIIDRMESLKLYSYRYLKKDENFRSHCFIKMIAEMVRADFKKQGTLFRTEKLLQKLSAVPIYTYPETAETEIIPYEDLWEMVVEILD